VLPIGCCRNTNLAAKFYKAVVQFVLLYDSKLWNLTKVVLARLEGFHISADYRVLQEHKPCKGLFGKWEYYSTKRNVAFIL
jgi:hypothetical protein